LTIFRQRATKLVNQFSSKFVFDSSESKKERETTRFKRENERESELRKSERNYL